MTQPGKTNGFDGPVLQSIVGRIEESLADLLSERGAYMQRCRVIREAITAVYDDAKEKGIPKKELRALIRTRELERKIEQTRSDLEADELETFEQLAEALGDFGNTPLGQAALDDRRRGEALDSLHS
jgi:uncharacterized protein (UPF0335 family)